MNRIKTWFANLLMAWFVRHMAWVTKHERFDINKTLDCETCGGAKVIFDLTGEGKDKTCGACDGTGTYISTYLRRWYLFKSKFFNVMLHNILRSDDDPDPHDHPWWFLSIILKNGYIDESYKFRVVWPMKMVVRWPNEQYEQRAGFFSKEDDAREDVTHYRPVIFEREGSRSGPFNEEVSPGSVVFRRATHIHRVVLHKGEAWTLVFACGDFRPWGFIKEGVWSYWRKYLNAWTTKHV